MKTYALLAVALIAVGKFPALLEPLQWIGDGLIAVTTGPVWVIALLALTAWAHHKLAHHRPRIRVVPGQYTTTRKA